MDIDSNILYNKPGQSRLQFRRWRWFCRNQIVSTLLTEVGYPLLKL